jgi:hypothetical protein
MPTPSSPGGQPTKALFMTRFRVNTPRKVSLIAILGAILTIIVGASFASMQSTNAPTALETDFVRWITLGFLVVGALAYAVGTRWLRDGRS